MVVDNRGSLTPGRSVATRVTQPGIDWRWRPSLSRDEWEQRARRAALGGDAAMQATVHEKGGVGEGVKGRRHEMWKEKKKEIWSSNSGDGGVGRRAQGVSHTNGRDGKK